MMVIGRFGEMQEQGVAELFGLPIVGTATLEEAACVLVKDSLNGVKRQVFFVNAHCVNVAAQNPKYSDVLQQADYLYADGSGMRIAAQLAGESLRDNLNGTDLFPLLCEAAVQAKVKIALIGAKPGVAKRCAAQMRERYPGLLIEPIHHGYYKPSDEQELIERLNSSGASILLVAKGVPQQELWISSNAHRIDIPVLIGVGALFDFFSGDVPRAPLALRKVGLEWVHRLKNEPRRLFTRYVFGNPLFLSRVLFLRLQGRRVLCSQSLHPESRG